MFFLLPKVVNCLPIGPHLLDIHHGSEASQVGILAARDLTERDPGYFSTDTAPDTRS